MKLRLVNSKKKHSFAILADNFKENGLACRNSFRFRSDVLAFKQVSTRTCTDMTSE